MKSPTRQRIAFAVYVACVAVVQLAYATHRATAAGHRDGERGGSSSAIYANAIGGSTSKVAAPYFDASAATNVTALVGKTTYLNCKVKNLGNKTVSWVRHRDVHLLTVGRYTYTSDQRFRAINDQQSAENWTLMVRYPQARDSGVYECQISTTPHISHYVHLNVVEPSTEILGGPDVYIDEGSTINLTCLISFSPEPPAYILWNHDDAMISYESPRGGVNVITEKGETTVSYLLIQKATDSDNGKYQCSPSNGRAKSVQVHVLNGEHPAAIQHGGQAHRRTSRAHALIVCVTLLMLVP